MTKELIKQEAYDPMFDNMMQAMMMVMMIMVILPTIPAIQNVQGYLASQYSEGRIDARTLSATDVQQHIIYPIPCIGVYFINDGPDLVEMRINDIDSKPFVMNPNETITMNRSGSRDRIYAIFYKCYKDGTATLRITGEY